MFRGSRVVMLKAALLFATPVAVISLSIAHASQLGLSSTGVALSNRMYGSPVTCTLTAADDTYVRKDQTTLSFGNQTSLEVNNSSANTRRTLVRFDLSSCSPAISSDAIVHTATIRMTTASLASTASRSYELFRATSAWTESTTWSTQPSVAANATSTATIPALTVIGSTIQWPAARDVQSLVAADNTNFGWRVNDASEDGGLVPASITFNSSEAALNRPQLVITYAP